jgi:hypothetical protein
MAPGRGHFSLHFIRGEQPLLGRHDLCRLFDYEAAVDVGKYNRGRGQHDDSGYPAEDQSQNTKASAISHNTSLHSAG